MNRIVKMLADHPAGQNYVISYFGDSMQPKYKNGDLLKIKRISNIDVILWGESYFIITSNYANGLKLVRNIFPHTDITKLNLRSVDREKYSDIVVSKSDVLYLFIIKGKLEINHL